MNDGRKSFSNFLYKFVWMFAVADDDDKDDDDDDDDEDDGGW